MTAWAASVFVAFRRAVAAAIAAAPGMAFLLLYVKRLEAMHADPSLSPGTPAETIIALMVVTLAIASFVFARAIADGRVNRSIGAGGVLSFVTVVAVLSFTFMRLV